MAALYRERIPKKKKNYSSQSEHLFIIRVMSKFKAFKETSHKNSSDAIITKKYFIARCIAST